MDKPKQAKMQQRFKMIGPGCRISRHHSNRRGSISRRIRAFVSGASHGEDVLHALYGSIAAEPVPERLRTILKP